MHIMVLGAGAVGCYYAARLALSGKHVTLLARDAVAPRLRSEGVKLITEGQTLVARPAVVCDLAAAAQADVLLLCVKSGDTAHCARALAQTLPATATVVSLQNGVENPACLQHWLQRPVAAAAVYLASVMLAPGVVQHLGRGEILLGPAEAGAAADGLRAPLNELAQALREAGVGVEISDDVMSALWAKLVINCAYNALSALVMKGYGEWAHQWGMDKLRRAIVDEALAVAWAQGQKLDRDAIWAATERIAQTMPAQFSSTAQDLQRGRPTEIDHLNGTICRRGSALGVATPVNQALWTLVKAMEAAPFEALDGA
jgi:2-dehydropantoate 2-reductase